MRNRRRLKELPDGNAQIVSVKEFSYQLPLFSYNVV
jgi:hypothetical protein